MEIIGGKEDDYNPKRKYKIEIEQAVQSNIKNYRNQYEKYLEFKF